MGFGANAHLEENIIVTASLLLFGVDLKEPVGQTLRKPSHATTLHPAVF